MTDRKRSMIPEWAQYVMALSPVAIVVGMMLALYLFGNRSRAGNRPSSPRDALEAAKERGRHVRARRQSE
jgi:hypothetical protein